MTHRVSLSLPVRNGDRFLSQAIQSILDQSYADFELIITDNASTDATEDICRQFMGRDSRIRYVRSTQDRGAAANFNLGFHLSSGEYFKWCAHDDLISPDYIARCVEALDADSGAAVAYGKMIGIDENGEANGFVELHSPELSGLSPTRRFGRVLARHVLVGAVFGLYRRSALRRTSLHKPYYTSDCALLAEIALLGKIVCESNAVLLGREHPDQSSRLKSTERLSWQDPTASGTNPSEFSERVRHLVEIIYRHRDVAPLYKTAPALMIWASHPVLVGRLALEGIGTLSPSLRWRLRHAGMAVLGAISSLTAGSAATENCGTEFLPGTDHIHDENSLARPKSN
jgi:glycosyltransferase involved in cell wall biosynthesis